MSSRNNNNNNNTVTKIRRNIKLKKPTVKTKRRQSRNADPCEQLKRDLEYWSGVLEEQKKLNRQLKAILKDLPKSPNSWWLDADLSSMSVPELKEYWLVLQRSMLVVEQAKQRLRFVEKMKEIEISDAVSMIGDEGEE